MHALVGPERRRQDDAVQPAHRLPARRRPGTIDARRRATSPGCRRSRSPASAWPGRSRSPACSTQLTAREHVELALQGRDRARLAVLAVGRSCCGRFRARADGAARPGRARRPGRRRRPARSRTGRSGPWNWPWRWRWTRRCCCSTSRPPGMGVEDVDRTVELVTRGRERPHRGARRPQHARRRRAGRPGDRAAVRARCWPRVRTSEVRTRPERVITAYLGAEVARPC